MLNDGLYHQFAEIVVGYSEGQKAYELNCMGISH
jgi:hypothetical protein